MYVIEKFVRATVWARPAPKKSATGGHNALERDWPPGLRSQKVAVHPNTKTTWTSKAPKIMAFVPKSRGLKAIIVDIFGGGPSSFVLFRKISSVLWACPGRRFTWVIPAFLASISEAAWLFKTTFLGADRDTKEARECPMNYWRSR